MFRSPFADCLALVLLLPASSSLPVQVTSYFEDSPAADYRDASNTTAIWDSSQGEIRLSGLPLTTGPYCARGSFYAGTGAPWGCDAGNAMFDDGPHGDGAAGGGVYGVYVTADQTPGVHEWKIANTDWTEN